MGHFPAEMLSLDGDSVIWNGVFPLEGTWLQLQAHTVCQLHHRPQLVGLLPPCLVVRWQKKLQLKIKKQLKKSQGWLDARDAGHYQLLLSCHTL